jgi:hypothetical protein
MANKWGLTDKEHACRCDSCRVMFFTDSIQNFTFTDNSGKLLSLICYDCGTVRYVAEKYVRSVKQDSSDYQQSGPKQTVKPAVSRFDMVLDDSGDFPVLTFGKLKIEFHTREDGIEAVLVDAKGNKVSTTKIPWPENP